MSLFILYSICATYLTLSFGYKALGRGTDAVSGISRARGRGSPVQPHGVKRLEAPTEPAGETSPLDGAQRRKNGELLHLAIRRPVPPRRAHEYMAVRLCIEMRLLVPKGISISSLSEIPY